MRKTRKATRWIIAALLLNWSCAAAGQSSVDEQKVKLAIELLDRLDIAVASERGTEAIRLQTAALKRLPTNECPGLLVPKFRLETAEKTNAGSIDAEAAMAKMRLFVAQRRAANEALDASRPEALQSGSVGEILALVASAFQARVTGRSDHEYLVRLVEAERVADDCKTPEFISAESQNEIAANQHLLATLTSESSRLRVLFQRAELNAIAAATIRFETTLLEQRQQNSDAVKARTRVEDLQKTTESPELRKSRGDLAVAIRSFLRSR